MQQCIVINNLEFNEVFFKYGGLFELVWISVQLQDVLSLVQWG